MNDLTEFYYTLSTIPQVLAAFLSLSSIFLIYSYAQLKNEVVKIAENVHTLLSSYDNYEKIHEYRKLLFANLKAQSVKSIRTCLNVLLKNEEYTELLKNEEKKNRGNEARNRLIFQTTPYIKSIEKEILKATRLVKLSFYFGILAIISSVGLLPFTPQFCESFLLIASIFLIILTFLSILFMVLIIFRFLRFSKEEFD